MPSPFDTFTFDDGSQLPASPGEKELLTDCDEILSSHNLDDSARQSCLLALRGALRNYFHWREKQKTMPPELGGTGTPLGNAFRSWHPRVLGALDSLTALIRDEPWPLPSHFPVGQAEDFKHNLDVERTWIIQQLATFSSIMRDQYDGTRNNHRPVDWILRNLEEEIGTLLWLHEVQIAQHKHGCYYEVLERVHEAIGKPNTDTAYSIKAAFKNHPDWNT